MSQGDSYKIGYSQFSTAFSMKESWFLTGHRLLRAAEVLLEQLWRYKSEAEAIPKEKKSFESGDPDSETIERSLMEPQISLLVGYAFENFLKGLLVSQNPPELDSAMQLPKKFIEHDLNKLCGMTNVETDAAEEEFLRVLSEYSRWRGRYAIETNASKNATAWVNANNLLIVSSKYPGPVGWPDEFYSLYDKIFAKLKGG